MYACLLPSGLAHCACAMPTVRRLGIGEKFHSNRELEKNPTQAILALSAVNRILENYGFVRILTFFLLIAHLNTSSGMK